MQFFLTINLHKCELKEIEMDTTDLALICSAIGLGIAIAGLILK